MHEKRYCEEKTVHEHIQTARRTGRETLSIHPSNSHNGLQQIVQYMSRPGMKRSQRLHTQVLQHGLLRRVKLKLGSECRKTLVSTRDDHWDGLPEMISRSSVPEMLRQT